jgi:hypothetical protein
MQFKKMPANVWMVVDVAYNGWTVVSTHGSQNDAESERDRRNEGLARRRYSACMAPAPNIERVSLSCD